ncbi:EamA family transporter [Arthrobacter sp. Z1-15]
MAPITACDQAHLGVRPQGPLGRGYLYLGVIGTAPACTLWFRGIHLLPASTTAILGLLSPLVATSQDGHSSAKPLTPGQLIGATIILGTLALSTLRPAPNTTAGPYPASLQTTPGTENAR